MSEAGTIRAVVKVRQQADGTSYEYAAECPYTPPGVDLISDTLPLDGAVKLALRMAAESAVHHETSPDHNLGSRLLSEGTTDVEVGILRPYERYPTTYGGVHGWFNTIPVAKRATTPRPHPVEDNLAEVTSKLAAGVVDLELAGCHDGHDYPKITHQAGDVTITELSGTCARCGHARRSRCA